jgi:hypothetical protein
MAGARQNEARTAPLWAGLHKQFKRELNSYAMHGWRIQKMLKRIFPYLNRPDVEFVLECASFILFSAVFLNWVAHF